MSRQARHLRCPESVLGWIPWYADGTLTPRQKGAVEAHAAECSDCRAELDMIAGAPFEIDVDLPDPDRVFEEISARIDAELDAADGSAREGAPASPVIPIHRGRALSADELARVERWVVDGEDAREAAASPTAEVVPLPWLRSNVWAAAAAILLFVLGGLGGALWTGGGEAPARYELASHAGAPVAATGPFLDVAFVDSVSAATLSATLRRAGAEIVSGPSSLGVYRIRLLEGANGEARSTEDAKSLATRLRAGASPVARYAEVHAATTP